MKGFQIKQKVQRRVMVNNSPNYNKLFKKRKNKIKENNESKWFKFVLDVSIDVVIGIICYLIFKNGGRI